MELNRGGRGDSRRSRGFEEVERIRGGRGEDSRRSRGFEEVEGI